MKLKRYVSVLAAAAAVLSIQLYPGPARANMETKTSCITDWGWSWKEKIGLSETGNMDNVYLLCHNCYTEKILIPGVNEFPAFDLHLPTGVSTLQFNKPFISSVVTLVGLDLNRYFTTNPSGERQLNPDILVAWSYTTDLPDAHQTSPTAANQKILSMYSAADVLNPNVDTVSDLYGPVTDQPGGMETGYDCFEQPDLCTRGDGVPRTGADADGLITFVMQGLGLLGMDDAFSYYADKVDYIGNVNVAAFTPTQPAFNKTQHKALEGKMVRINAWASNASCDADLPSDAPFFQSDLPRCQCGLNGDNVCDQGTELVWAQFPTDTIFTKIVSPNGK